MVVDEELKQAILQIIKENLKIELDISHTYYANSFDATVTLKLLDEEISCSTQGFTVYLD